VATRRPARNGRCIARTARGDQCRRSALADSDVCAIHAGADVGAPTKLSPELVDKIVAILRAGGYPETAASVAGICTKTYGRWLARGNPEGDDPANAPFRRFRERVESALAEGEARNVALIARAAMDNWQAAAWLLERQHPERWARVSQRPSEEQPARSGPGDPFAEVDELAARRRPA
jgi:hypothetical protein